MNKMPKSDVVNYAPCFFFPECPSAGFYVPSVSDTLQCSVSDRCLGVECCVNLDFKIAKLMMKSWITMDPCNFQFSVGFEKLVFNLTLFGYEWGTKESVDISDFLKARFEISYL